MTMLSDSKRRSIVARRRKMRNATKRAAKAAKRERNRKAEIAEERGEAPSAE